MAAVAVSNRIRKGGKRMNRNRVLLIGAVLLLALAIPGVAIARHGGNAAAHLHPSNQSGVSADITFVDDGATLTVTGTATGLSEFSV